MLDSERVVLNKSLIEYAFFDYNKPVVVCFNPAGMLLTKKQINASKHAWCYNFLVKQQINVVAINTVNDNHWFSCSELKEYLKGITSLLQKFPERLGYGVSMGAYGVSCFSSLLNLDRALLFSPLLPPESDPSQHFSNINNTHFTVVYDPFNAEDKTIALRYPTHTQYLHFYGVGHQVIESIAKIDYLKGFFFAFYNNEPYRKEFYYHQRKKRQLVRYYSYMDRNPTGKNTLKRKLIVKKHKFIFMINNVDQVYIKVRNRLLKSIKKQTTKYNM
ncbi:hypothetical protein [Photobacterium lutimaris]|uniref:Alpha/beta hydrolase n=1 Tax=Photobacterium lutimaris TaxID=388278 RepID=A0A2T3IWY2_9GAMM|nr:hypothetical protein [Photobacterium lutimaris]PSU32979.1 hypothetical protein C9I99_15345 [Photobacterium lutimaris]TDR74035.1 hypothetical protein DFP78_10994 [Photobacterium lutimaris]